MKKALQSTFGGLGKALCLQSCRGRFLQIKNMSLKHKHTVASSSCQKSAAVTQSRPADSFLPAHPNPVGRGILSEPPECFRRSWRDFCTRFRVQSWCHTGSSRPLMHWMMHSFSSAVRSPLWWATYTMKDMSMLTASPWSSAGKTLCLGQKKVGNTD